MLLCLGFGLGLGLRNYVVDDAGLEPHGRSASPTVGALSSVVGVIVHHDLCKPEIARVGDSCVDDASGFCVDVHARVQHSVTIFLSPADSSPFDDQATREKFPTHIGRALRHVLDLRVDTLNLPLVNQPAPRKVQEELVDLWYHFLLLSLSCALTLLPSHVLAVYALTLLTHTLLL